MAKVKFHLKNSTSSRRIPENVISPVHITAEQLSKDRGEYDNEWLPVEDFVDSSEPDFMDTVPTFSSRATCLIGLAILFPTLSWGAPDAKRFISESTSKLKDIVISAYDIFFIALGAVSAINLIIAISAYMKGDHDSQQKIVRWLVGVIISLLFMTILRTLFF